MTATARPPLADAGVVALRPGLTDHERDSRNRTFCATHGRLWVLVAGEQYRARRTIREGWIHQRRKPRASEPVTGGYRVPLPTSERIPRERFIEWFDVPDAEVAASVARFIQWRTRARRRD